MRKLKIDQLKKFTNQVEKETRLFDQYKRKQHQVPQEVQRLIDEVSYQQQSLHYHNNNNSIANSNSNLTAQSSNNINKHKKAMTFRAQTRKSEDSHQQNSQRSINSKGGTANLSYKPQYQNQFIDHKNSKNYIQDGHGTFGRPMSSAGYKSTRVDNDESTLQSHYTKKNKLNEIVQFEQEESSQQYNTDSYEQKYKILSTNKTRIVSKAFHQDEQTNKIQIKQKNFQSVDYLASQFQDQKKDFKKKQTGDEDQEANFYQDFKYTKEQQARDLMHVRRLKSHPNLLLPKREDYQLVSLRGEQGQGQDQNQEGRYDPNQGNVQITPEVMQDINQGQNQEIKDLQKQNEKRINRIINYNLEKGGSRGVTPDQSVSSKDDQTDQLIKFSFKDENAENIYDEFSQKLQEKEKIEKQKKEEKLLEQKNRKKEQMMNQWQSQGSLSNYTRKRFMYQSHFGSPLSQQGAALRYINIVNPELNQSRATELILKKKQGIYNHEKEVKRISKAKIKENQGNSLKNKEMKKYQEITKKKLFSQDSNEDILSSSKKLQSTPSKHLKSQRVFSPESSNPNLKKSNLKNLSSNYKNDIKNSDQLISQKRLQSQKVQFNSTELKHGDSYKQIFPENLNLSKTKLRDFTDRTRQNTETLETQTSQRNQQMSLKQSSIQREQTHNNINDDQHTYREQQAIISNKSPQKVIKNMKNVTNMTNLMSKLTENVMSMPSNRQLTEEEKQWQQYLADKWAGCSKNLKQDQFRQQWYKEKKRKVIREKKQFEVEREKLSNFLSNPMINIWLGERRNLVDIDDFDKKLDFFKDIAAENMDNKRLREIFQKFEAYEKAELSKRKKGYQRSHNLTDQDVEKDLSDTKNRLNLKESFSKTQLLFASEVVRKGLSQKELDELKRKLIYYETEEARFQEIESQLQKQIKEIKAKNAPQVKIYERTDKIFFDMYEMGPNQKQKQSLKWTEENRQEIKNNLNKIEERVQENLQEEINQEPTEYINRMKNQVRRSKRLENYKVKKMRLCQKFIDYAKRVKDLNTTYTDDRVKGSFPLVAFERKLSKKFFKAVKLNEEIQVKGLLIKDPYLIYQKDHLNNNVLHWAVKRKLPEMCKVLIKKDVDINEKNLEGRVPLYYAVKDNDEELVRALIQDMSTPWVCTENELKEINPGKQVIKLIKAAKQIHINSAKHESHEERVKSLKLELNNLQHHINLMDEEEERKRKEKEQDEELSHMIRQEAKRKDQINSIMADL